MFINDVTLESSQESGNYDYESNDKLDPLEPRHKSPIPKIVAKYLVWAIIIIIGKTVTSRLHGQD